MENKMKNLNILALIVGITTAQLCAYEFSFLNTTAIPLGIAIQFANSENEPLYKLYIKPGILKSFVPGSIDIPDIKWSFCLKHIYYIKNPTMQERAYNFAKITAWKKTPITWINERLKTTPPAKLIPTRIQRDNNPFNEPILVRKKVIPGENKSLCKDRHFEIIEDKYGKIAIIGSTIE
jgi:hypothetical protein